MTTTPIYTRWGVQVFHGDCLNIMREMADASIDAILTDPPYGLSDLTVKRITAALTKWLAGDREYTPPGRGGFMGKSWDSFVPPPAVWDECYRVLKPGGYLLSFAGTRSIDLMGMSIRLAGFEYRDSIGNPILAWTFGSGFPKGNAQLKPSWEPIIMVRKPFVGSLEANVLTHGTGALNIAACRVGSPDDKRAAGTRTYASGKLAGGHQIGEPLQAAPHDGFGRWPPNVVLTHAPLVDPVSGEVIADACADGCVDGCPVQELDTQSGITTSGNRKQGQYGLMGYMGADTAPMPAVNGDSGGASRYFPCFRWEPKAPTAERPKINGAAHPTVKPVSLLRWAAKLICPPGGTILDCFAGTGTTGQAARAEGYPCILIENDPDSIRLIRARLDAHPKTGTPPAGGNPAETTTPSQGDLFDLLGGASA